MYKLIVAGSREFDNWYLLNAYLNQIIENYPNVTEYSDGLEIVSGTAKGADKLGENWAIENKTPVKKFPADWEKYGKSAGYIRNEEMAKYADGLVAFWDGKSRGTKHMIDLARKYNLDVWVLQYDD